MLKRHEIKVLLKAGHAQREVAKLAVLSLRSVTRTNGARVALHGYDSG